VLCWCKAQPSRPYVPQETGTVEDSQFSGQFVGWAAGGSSLPAAPSGVLSGCEAAGA